MNIKKLQNYKKKLNCRFNVCSYFERALVLLDDNVGK